MRKRHLTICLLLISGACAFAAEARLNEVTADHAALVAQNWIQTIIHHQKHWGGAKQAQLLNIVPVLRNKRLLGYCALVEPRGYIIVSARREFSPIKCFSDNSAFDPAADTGFADVVKAGLEKNLDVLTTRASEKALIRIKTQATTYASTWSDLQSNPDTFASALAAQTTSLKALIQRGPLLASHWHQNYPYNDQCPVLDCDGKDKNAPVGCVATAASQIMNYWDWPPYGTADFYDADFDWTQILDDYIFDGDDVRWEGPDGTPVTADQFDAVAFLCHKVGQAAGADYGCDETSAWLGSKPGRDMTDAFKDYLRYDSDANYEIRDFASASSWYYTIRADLNANGPLIYGIQTSFLLGGHAMVCDGWMENGSLLMIHLNYGWGGSTDGWYSLDDVPESYTPSTESIVHSILPAGAVGQTVSGTYTKQLFPWRYFNTNASGQYATFSPGQFLQFFGDRAVACSTASASDRIAFQGAPTNKTRLFTPGDISRGIRIDNGAIHLHNRGTIKFTR